MCSRCQMVKLGLIGLVRFWNSRKRPIKRALCTAHRPPCSCSRRWNKYPTSTQLWAIYNFTTRSRWRKKASWYKWWTLYYLHRVPSSSHLCVQAKQNQSAVEEPSILSELQNLREQLEKSEEERKSIETQLSEANSTVTKLQEEGSREIFLTKQNLTEALEKRVKGKNWSMTCNMMQAAHMDNEGFHFEK